MEQTEQIMQSEVTDASTKIKIGTRSSPLAIIQAEEIRDALKEAWPDKSFAIESMKTLGDRDKTTPLPAFNAKSLWTHDLEVLLQDGTLDLIVHSLKDMPTQLPESLSLGAIPARSDPRDALIVSPKLAADHNSLASLPEGSIIGTSSVRRSAQIKHLYPHLQIEDCRGNIDTRLRKLDDPNGRYSALILAAAGLIRIGKQNRITKLLSKADGGMLHAVGQGGLGVEIRAQDVKTETMLQDVVCEKTTMACFAERSLMRTLEGGCSVPIGVETEWVKSDSASNMEVGHTSDLMLRAVVVSLDGQEWVEAEMTKRITNKEEANRFGSEVAAQLSEKGADKILEKINLIRAAPEGHQNT